MSSFMERRVFDLCDPLLKNDFQVGIEARKQSKSLKRSIVKLPAIVQAAADVVDFFTVAVCFGIKKSNGGHTHSIQ